jgi:multidrug efflux system outer membrane protein
MNKETVSMRYFTIRPLTRALLGSGIALTLNACALQSDAPKLAADDVPSAWVARVDEEASTWPQSTWWDSFADPELSSLIDTIEQRNFDLANNRRTLEAAQITLREAGFDLLPTGSITLGTGASYSESRSDGSTQSNNRNVPFELGASLSYGNIIAKPAIYTKAVADYESRAAQSADVALTTLGTSASTYFQLLLIRDKIRASLQNVENAQAISNIANARVEAGVAVPIEALQQQIALQREIANLSNFRQSELSALASLALLSGTGVQEFSVAGETLNEVTVPSVQPGLPSELLLRRPDLVQAEALLRSATANVDIVRTAYFPNISLTGNLSAGSTSLTELLASPDTFLNLNASVLQTLLDNGQRGRNVERSQLTLESSLSDYRKAVLGAFNEIEVLLSNIQVQNELVGVALQNLDAAEESFRIAQVRYEEGVTDFQTVLTSQNTLFSTRNSYLDTKLSQLNTTVSLYQALGGGWEREAQ